MSTPNSPYDPTPLLLVCDSIIEDGEISGAELYELAEWLNSNREACYHWPGNMLVKPLQDIWADGKVNKTEMRQMGRLLVRIRKEWARLQREQAEERAEQVVRELASSFDLWRPCVPSIPYNARVRSHSEVGVLYDVDLNGPSCSCADWQTVRHRHPVTHPNRCCKHILETYSKIAPGIGWPEWLAPLIGAGYPAHPGAKWFVLNINGSPILGSTAPKEWANVFAPDGSHYERFGYNRIEQRWSYATEPEGAQHIAHAIHQNSGW